MANLMTMMNWKTRLVKPAGMLFVSLFVFQFMPGPTMDCAFASPPPFCLQDDDEEEDKEQTESEKIEADQKVLADKYRLLEEKLFSLHEFEKGNNPTRSKLLERAYIQSQEKMTTSQMKLVVRFLEQSKFKSAEDEQELVLVNLNQLLELLQSEDRGKRVRDAIKRNQEYLKEVERILRTQKGIRGQTEGGLDAQRLANSQAKAAKRTKDLADQIRGNEEGRNEEGDNSDTESNKDKKDPKDDPAADPKDSQGSKKGKGSKGDPKSGDSTPEDEKKPGGPKDDKNSDDNSKENDDKDDDEKDDADKESDDKPTDPKDGSPSNTPGQPGQPGSGQGEPGSGQPQDQPPQDQNPARKRIQAALERMKNAKKKLDEAQRDDAIEDMKKAERELALAKKELEEILRQLREEEVERSLAMLESRFRQMLEREQKLYQATQKLENLDPQQRGTEFEIRAGKLAVQQNEIATEAARALLLLVEDGSSIAFPATVEEMHQDMLQVAGRLTSAKVGRITIEIEEDIIDTLDYLIKALVVTQADMERMKQKAQQGKMGRPGDMPLVDQLAEIKMLRGLQERIFRRHSRYSKFLDDPDDPVGSTDDPELQAALERLANKQSDLTNIAKDIMNEKNK